MLQLTDWQQMLTYKQLGILINVRLMNNINFRKKLSARYLIISILYLYLCLLGCNSASLNKVEEKEENIVTINKLKEIGFKKETKLIIPNPHLKKIKSKNELAGLIDKKNNAHLDTIKRFGENGYTEIEVRVSCLKIDSTQQCVDTVYKFIYDTLARNCKLGKITRLDTLKMFEAYFDQNLCPPDNLNHPKYVNYVKKSELLLQKTKEKILNLFRLPRNKMWDEQSEGLKIIGDSNKMYKYEWITLPTYYLTFNVVKYDDEIDNLLKYYNLDTTILKYGILENGLLKLIVHDIKGAIDFNIYDLDLCDKYNKIVKMRKTPIALSDPFTAQANEVAPPSGILDIVYLKNKNFITLSKNEVKMAYKNINDQRIRFEFIKEFSVIAESARLCKETNKTQSPITTLVGYGYKKLLHYFKNKKS